MRLYIVRHGIAVPSGTPGIAENDRPLTKEGIEKMEKVASGLRNLDIVPDLILSSPLPRAKQTAEIVRRILGDQVPLKITETLAPGGNRTQLYREFPAKPKLEGIMIVGHQPSLGEIAGEIAWGSDQNYIVLKKGGACAIELESLQPVPHGSLLWLLTPSILRKL